MAETTIPERIAQAVRLALIESQRIEGIDDRVYRAREDAISRDEGDQINLRSESEQMQPQSDEVDDAEYILAVQIYVNGADWESKADAYAIKVHRLILGYDYLNAGIRLLRVRRTDGDWGGDEGDTTPGKRTLRYGFRYMSFAADLTTQP